MFRVRDIRFINQHYYYITLESGLSNAQFLECILSRVGLEFNNQKNYLFKFFILNVFVDKEYKREMANLYLVGYVGIELTSQPACLEKSRDVKST